MMLYNGYEIIFGVVLTVLAVLAIAVCYLSARNPINPVGRTI